METRKYLFETKWKQFLKENKVLDYDIMIDSVVYGSSTITPDSSTADKPVIWRLTPAEAQDIIRQINDDIESKNIRDDETGEYQYDVSYLSDDIKFECYIDIDNQRINLTVTYSGTGELEDVDIPDQDIADKYGITEMDIINRL